MNKKVQQVQQYKLKTIFYLTYHFPTTPLKQTFDSFTYPICNLYFGDMTPITFLFGGNNDSRGNAR